MGFVGLSLGVGLTIGVSLGLGDAPIVGEGLGDGLSTSCGAVKRNALSVPDGTPEMTLVVALDFSCCSIWAGVRYPNF